MLNSITSPKDVLKHFWHYNSFRPLQEDIINSIISGNDTFALLPTGGGKSLCYQVPALVLDGLCIVISPLISLMTDQVNDLNNRGIRAILINSFMSKKDIDHSLDNVIYGNYKMLYISPERIQSEMFLERFKKMPVSFIAVDEAHCISQWGYDFRPSYLNISTLRNLKDVPILALTATATSAVADDIVKNLQLKNVSKFKKSFSRDNILFSSAKVENKLKYLLEWSKKIHESGIIYVRNRKKCREIALYLKNEGVKADFYHAGLPHESRIRAQNLWMNNRCQVIVATNAFGMGIDKSDVRFVIHIDLPDSLEAFYQEAGRAGRDGKMSNSIVLYSNSDILKLEENFKSTYPPIEEIKLIYHQLGVYYQIAEGSQPESAFKFNLNDFCERFKKPKQVVFHAIRQLEKADLISLSDGFYQPSKIKIINGKHDILNFRDENPAYDEIIGHLLRSYSGIIEQAVVISEEDIASKLKIDLKILESKLSYLHKINLIEYQVRNKDSLLSFNQPRKPINETGISTKDYNFLMTSALKRMSSMIQYVASKEICRSKIILNYFDEEGAPEFCGHCDVCLKKSGRKMPERINLRNDVLRAVGDSTRNISELRELFPEVDEDEIKKVCRELCRDELLILSSGGRLSRYAK